MSEEIISSQPCTVFEHRCNDLLEVYYKKFSNEKIIIWGTGLLGQLRLKLFRLYGMSDNVLAFCNTFHNTSSEVFVDGVLELSPYKAIECYPNATFIISSDYYEDIIKFINTELKSNIKWVLFDQKELMIEKQLVYYYISKPTSTTVGFNNYWFDIYKNLEKNGELTEYLDFVNSILDDEKSKFILKNRIDGILTGELSKILEIPIDENQYYSDNYFKITEHEVYFDCGAFNGDSLIDFIKFTGGKYEKVLSFEPDLKNYNKLEKLVRDEKYRNVNPICAATGSFNGEIGFSTTGTMAATIDTSEKNNCVPIVKLDNYLNERPSFIKMDIEGAELETIKGAETIIKTLKPKLAICIYHRPIDFYLIPLMLKQMVPEYKFKIRQHLVGFNELVLYACV